MGERGSLTGERGILWCAAMYMVPVLRDDGDSIVLVQDMLPSAERKLQAGQAPLAMELAPPV